MWSMITASTTMRSVAPPELPSSWATSSELVSAEANVRYGTASRPSLEQAERLNRIESGTADTAPQRTLLPVHRRGAERPDTWCWRSSVLAPSTKGKASWRRVDIQLDQRSND